MWNLFLCSLYAFCCPSPLPLYVLNGFIVHKATHFYVPRRYISRVETTPLEVMLSSLRTYVKISLCASWSGSSTTSARRQHPNVNEQCSIKLIRPDSHHADADLSRRFYRRGPTVPLRRGFRGRCLPQRAAAKQTRCSSLVVLNHTYSIQAAPRLPSRLLAPQGHGRHQDERYGDGRFPDRLGLGPLLRQ